MRLSGHTSSGIVAVVVVWMVHMAQFPVTPACDLAAVYAQFVSQQLADAAHGASFAGQVNAGVCDRWRGLAQGVFQRLASEALATNYINEKDMETLKEWRQNPSVWKK